MILSECLFLQWGWTDGCSWDDHGGGGKHTCQFWEQVRSCSFYSCGGLLLALSFKETKHVWGFLSTVFWLIKTECESAQHRNTLTSGSGWRPHLALMFPGRTRWKRWKTKAPKRWPWTSGRPCRTRSAPRWSSTSASPTRAPTASGRKDTCCTSPRAKTWVWEGKFV